MLADIPFKKRFGSVLEPLRLGGARSGAKELLDNSTGQVTDTTHDIAVRKSLDDVFHEVPDIIALCGEDVD